MVSQNPKPSINYHLEALNNIPNFSIYKKAAVQSEKMDNLIALVLFFFWFKHRNAYHRGNKIKQNLLLFPGLEHKES